MYSWCSQNSTEMLPTLIKSFLKPSTNASHERCLAFNSTSKADNSSALAHTSCANDRLPFICELPCAGPTCPAALTCAKNVDICNIEHTVWNKKLNLLTGYSIWNRWQSKRYIIWCFDFVWVLISKRIMAFHKNEHIAAWSDIFERQ